MTYWGGSKIVRLRQQVIATYGRVCHLCGQPILGQVSIDHIVPRSKGGLDNIENLRPAHRRCNSRRGTRPVPTPLHTATDW